jgi:hypothetical protein
MEYRPFGIDPTQVQPYQWTVTIDGEEVQYLESRYSGHVSEQEWDTVRNTAARSLSLCPDPASSSGRTTGLALGKVQSGKTLSYTVLIALAIDNGYRITVVLAGTKNPLLEQNYSRLCRDLEATRPNLTPFRNPPPHDAEVVRSVLHGGGHALIVVLKNRRRIDDARRILSTPEICRHPTIIIDDEGDEASLNTQFRRGTTSAVYNSILRLREVLPLHAYVAYTATPQANLLISGIDGLSPDFGVLVEPGEGYCGGSTFFGTEGDQYVRTVHVAEAEQDHVVGIPDGLRSAIATFLVGGAIRHLREPGTWHCMLIHNSNLRADHQSLQSTVWRLIGLWRETLALPNTDPAVADLLALFREAFDDLCTTVQNPPSWDAVSQRLRDEVWLVEVWMVNSLPLGRDPIATPFRLRNNILIGGNMLSRGVTIEGLAVTYITRRAQQETNADTMEQRARWFGYKEPYLDVCRIFLTSRLRDDYTELLRHEDDFWDALRRNERQGLSVRDWPRMFSLDMNLGLRPTRTMVANFRQFRGGGWDIQNHLVEDQAVALRNIDVVREFFSRHPGQIRKYGNVEHMMVSDCNTGAVISELLARLHTEGTDWENRYTIEYLARLLLGNRLPVMDVLWMSRGNFRERNPRRNGQINRINPMQGRSPGRDVTDALFYPGDMEIHGDRVQLQVHFIRMRNSNALSSVETNALALYIPRDDPRYDLRYVVRDEVQ